MTFASIPSGTSVFLDANPLVYHAQPHPTLAQACGDLLLRIEQGDLLGFTSTHILSEIAHRLMTIEAMSVFGWVASKVPQRLRQHPTYLQQLHRFQDSIDEILNSPVHVLPISAAHIAQATCISRQTGLLSNDALIVAVMQAHGLTGLASNDTDFDRVPGLTRYAPA